MLLQFVPSDQSRYKILLFTGGMSVSSFLRNGKSFKGVDVILVGKFYNHYNIKLYDIIHTVHFLIIGGNHMFYFLKWMETSH